MTVIRKIAVTGPESTGKSWLTRYLADHYQTVYVPEYAREYIDHLDRDYVRQDITNIAKGQLSAEYEAMQKARGLLFCDTELIVTKIWSLHKYGICDPWILGEITNNPYDLVLLCDVDMPWEPDPQREHPHLRTYFFDWFLRELNGYGFHYHIIRGRGEERQDNALKAVEEFLSEKG